MANPETIKLGKQMREDRDLLRKQYQELGSEHPVIADILRECDENRESEHKSAVALGNSDPYKSAVALQRAHAYATLRTYIKTMLM